MALSVTFFGVMILKSLYKLAIVYFRHIERIPISEARYSSKMKNEPRGSVSKSSLHDNNASRFPQILSEYFPNLTR